MPLGTFTQMKKRALPIFILVDISSSMSWRGKSPRDTSLPQSKIDTVNQALKKMIATLKKDTETTMKSGIYYKMCLISFGKDNVIVHQERPEDVRNINFKPFAAKGNTPVKLALEKLNTMLDNIDSIDYAPTVILLSDGHPSDYDGPAGKNATKEDYLNWAPIKNLYAKKISAKTNFIAISVGEESRDFILAFLKDKQDNFLKADKVETITKSFEYITQSITTRASTNPDTIYTIKQVESDVIF